MATETAAHRLIIMPAHNEVENLPRVLAEIRADGSRL